MKKRVVLLLCALLAVSTVGCGKKNETTPESETKQQQETQVQESEQQAETEANAEASRVLSSEEIAFFTSFIQEEGNYGFLMSVYDSADKVNLDDLLYSGAGMCNDEATEEQIADYLSVSGQEELFSDLNALTTNQINEYLLTKTGYSLADMKNAMTYWTYSEATDTYYSEVGDTNYEPFTCKGGTVSGDVYTVQFCSDFTWDGYQIAWKETTIKKVGENYQFVSNRLMTERNAIESATVNCNHETLGDVSLVAYGIEDDVENPKQDVTFKIMQGDEELQTLFGPYSDNNRVDDMFVEVVEAAFADINADGQKDIITICSYSGDKGNGDGAIYQELRLYEFSEYGAFVFNEELTATIEASLTEFTVDSVLGALDVR